MVSESGEELQMLMDVVHSHCQKCRLNANIMKKSAVMTCGKSLIGSGQMGHFSAVSHMYYDI